MYSKHLHVCFVTKSHTLWANSSHHSKLVVICLHDVYIVYILCTADNVLFWQLSSHYHLKIHSGGHNFVSKYYIPTLFERNTYQRKKINYSKSAYTLLKTWLCIENLFSSGYMPSVDICCNQNNIRIHTIFGLIISEKKTSGFETFIFLFKIFKSCPSLGNLQKKTSTYFLRFLITKDVI